MTYLDFDDIARKIREKKNRAQGEIEKLQIELEGAKGGEVKREVKQTVADPDSV